MTIRFLPLAGIMLALAACAGKPGGNAGPAVSTPVAATDQYSAVLARLERGEAKQAKKLLEAIVKRNPADQRAASLLRTITEDPQVLLGAKSFGYAVKAGDTLPALASRFLGNGDRFYALARYNGIDDPRTLASGRMLRIPGEEPRIAPVAKPRPATATPARRKPTPAAGKPRPAPVAAVTARPTPAAANPARAAQLRAGGLAALNRGQVDRAVVLLGQASSANPGSAAIRADLARAQRIRATVKARR